MKYGIVFTEIGRVALRSFDVYTLDDPTTGRYSESVSSSVHHQASSHQHDTQSFTRLV